MEIKIGMKFTPRSECRKGKQPRIWTVSDILKTYNSAGEHVQTRYEAFHEFMGQRIYNRDFVQPTIAMGLLRQEVSQ